MKTPRYREVECRACEGAGTVVHVNGDWLREQRLATGMSLREVAARLGVSSAYLSDVELNRRTITDERLAQLLLLLR